MIGTHAPKMLNPRLKQPGFCARIIAPENDVVSSATTNMRRQVFGCPTSAADMPQAKALAAQAEEGGWSSDAALPAIRDPQLKQLIVPNGDWRADEYLAVSPVASMGLAHELFHRLREQRAPYVKWLVQPIPAALGNHGEALTAQAGIMRMMRRGQSSLETGSVWRGDKPIAMLRCRVQRMNISGGMVCVGWPAMTAIGGLVHAIERKTGCNLRFAVGAEDVQWVAGARHTVNRGAAIKTKGVRAGQILGKTATPNYGYMRDEIEANGWITLLLDGAEDPSILASALLGLTRIAGGSVFDAAFRVVHPGDAVGRAMFLIDASSEMKRRPRAVDALDAALEAYMRNGEWNDAGQWRQVVNGYGLNMTGYAPLELPQQRSGTRDNYPHAWVEPVFSLVTQGPLTPMGWWQFTHGDYGVRWRAT